VAIAAVATLRSLARFESRQTSTTRRRRSPAPSLRLCSAAFRRTKELAACHITAGPIGEAARPRRRMQAARAIYKLLSERYG